MKKLAAALAVSATVGMFLVGSPASAGEASTAAFCQSGSYCLWSQANFTGIPAGGSVPGRNWCVDHQRLHLSGRNDTGYTLTMTSGTCERPGISFYLHPGEEIARFNYPVRSVSLCLDC